MDHEGLMRRSEDELAEEMCRGTSAAEERDIAAAGAGAFERAGQVEADGPGTVAPCEMGWCWIE